jgi:tetratricopeptide (TPR) repeat protein
MPVSMSAFSPTAAPQSMTPPSPVAKEGNPFSKLDINPFIFVIIGGLILAFVLLTQTKSYVQKKIIVKDESSFDEQIEGTDKFNENQQQVILEKGKDTQQYAEAQAFYLRGFREYREANYLRAVQDFEAALALYPSHPLAKRYLERSQLKNKEYISSAMERGERDFQQQRYMNAFNEYRTVILLTNDPKNKNYQLAQKRVETIQLILTNNR